MAMKGRKISRTHAAYYHASRRAWERYELPLLIEDYDEFCTAIQISPRKTSRLHVTARFQYRLSNSRTTWEISFDEKKYLVAYHKGIKKILTFLPPESVEGDQASIEAGEDQV